LAAGALGDDLSDERAAVDAARGDRLEKACTLVATGNCGVMTLPFDHSINPTTVTLRACDTRAIFQTTLKL